MRFDVTFHMVCASSLALLCAQHLHGSSSRPQPDTKSAVPLKESLSDGSKTAASTVPAERGKASDAAATGAPQAVRRTHLQLNDEKTEVEFLRLLRGKIAVVEDMTVLKRLIREKQVEVTALNEELAKDYQIKPEGAYHYDRQSATIYELPAAALTNAVSEPVRSNILAGAVAPSSTGTPRRVHMELKDAKKAQRFENLTVGRQIASQQISAMTLLVRQKEMELGRYEEVLLAKFSMSKDRGYQYDPETKILYELVPVPGAQNPEKKATEKSDKEKASDKTDGHKPTEKSDKEKAPAKIDKDKAADKPDKKN